MLITVMNLLDLTQSTALPSPTSTVSQSQQSTSSRTSSITLASSPSTSTSDAHVNAVGGGVVGGLLGLFILCGLLYGYFRWKKRLSRDREILSSRIDTENHASGDVEEEPPTTQVQATALNVILPLR